jgi:hypothetical protein
MRSLTISALLVAVVCLASTPSGAQSAHEGALSGDLSGLSDAEIDERVDFLTDRLQEGQRNAKIWQVGFTTGWSLGIVVGTVQAATTSQSETRATAIVTATKASLGVARLLLFPHPGARGADPILAIDGSSRAANLARLEAGELQLSKTAKRAAQRKTWLPHLSNVGINLVGGGILLGVADTSDALISAGVGIFFGEVMLWTTPWRSLQDVEDYEHRFDDGLPSKPQTTWRLAPRMNGAALEVTF